MRAYNNKFKKFCVKLKQNFCFHTQSPHSSIFQFYFTLSSVFIAIRNIHKNMTGGRYDERFVCNIRLRPHITNILTHIHSFTTYDKTNNSSHHRPTFLIPSSHRLLTLYSIMTTKTSCLYTAYINYIHIHTYIHR